MRDTQNVVTPTSSPTMTRAVLRSRLRVEQLVSHSLGPVSFSLDEGECMGLSGPSGSGKTLLLRAIADLDPHAGEVSLDGVACRSMRGHLWRRRVGMLPAESQWWWPTVGEHFTRIDAEMHALLGFERAVLHWPITRLSSGERQRLALLRLLAQQPQVLLLDEPSANLDNNNVRQVETLIADYCGRHNACVVWVSHDLEQIARLGGRHYRLADGKLVDA